MNTVIRNDRDYELALEVIGNLMEAEPEVGSDEADQLETLALLVEAYETRKWPDTLPTPVEAIRFRMEQADLKQRDLVPYFGSASRVSEVLAGKRTLSLQMIRNLSDGLGIPAHVLIQDPESDDVSEEIDWSAFPAREMAERGWIPADALKNAAALATALREFFAPLGTDSLANALFRTGSHVRASLGMDQASLMAWTAKVRLTALNVESNTKYEHGSITLEFLGELAKVSWAKNGPSLAGEFLAEAGIILVVEPHLPGTRLDGVAVLSDRSKPIVGLTLRYDRVDNFWFVLMHELAHIALHFDTSAEIFLDDLDAETADLVEKEADELAGEALIPSNAWRRSPASRLRTASAAKHLARSLGIHPAIVAGRMRHHFNSYQILADEVGQGEVRRCFPNFSAESSDE